jgi:hypothetical protein
VEDIFAGAALPAAAEPGVLAADEEEILVKSCSNSDS